MKGRLLVCKGVNQCLLLRLAPSIPFTLLPLPHPIGGVRPPFFVTATSRSLL